MTMTRVGQAVAAGAGIEGTPLMKADSGLGGPLRATPVPGWERGLPWLWAGTSWRVDGFGAGGWPGDEDGAEAWSAAREGEVAGSLPHERKAGSRLATAEREIAAVTGGLLEGGWGTVVRSRQVHGARCRIHGDLPAGDCVAGDGDGHVTQESGVLLAVTLADCVPVFVADPANRAVGIFHAGWRGTAAGVVENGLRAMRRAFGSAAAELRLHLGPAICGRCYEVGPEVFAALGELPPPHPRPLDLRRVIRRRALAAGVPPGHLTTSAECTLCGDGRYYSHRGGDRGRHLGLIGIVAER